MRSMKRLALLTIATLAMAAMMATTASAVPSPNGDYEQDNWKRVTVKGFNTAVNNWSTCPANTYLTNPNMWCKKDSGSFTWHWRYTSGPTVNYDCTNAALRFNITGDGTTLIASASWYNPNQAYDRCSIYEPKSYASDPAEQAALTGQICKHIPTNTFYIGQGVVIGPRFPSGVHSTEYWQPTFAKLTGNPYYFSPTDTYPLGTGLQTAHFAIGSSASYQMSGGAPGSSASGWRQYAEFPFHNTLLTPNTTPCVWAGLT